MGPAVAITLSLLTVLGLLTGLWGMDRMDRDRRDGRGVLRLSGDLTLTLAGMGLFAVSLFLMGA